MTRLSIGYDVRALTRSRSGAIWGPIWIVLGDDSFPEVSWNDMPVALLGEFARAVGQLSVGATEVVRFFDGPLSVEFQRASAGLVDVSLDGGTVRTSLAGAVSFEELRAAVQGAVNDMYQGCIELGWSDDTDVRRLGAYAEE